MKRGLFVSILLFCGWVSYAQSDLTFMLDKEGKMIVIPKKMNYEFHIPPTPTSRTRRRRRKAST